MKGTLLITRSVYGIAQFTRHFQVFDLIVSTTNPVRETGAKKPLKKAFTGPGV